jgi:hypothetical protein
LTSPTLGCALIVGNVDGTATWLDASATPADSGAHPDASMPHADSSPVDATDAVAASDTAADARGIADALQGADAHTAGWTPPVTIAAATFPQGLTILDGVLYWIDDGTTVRALSPTAGAFGPADAGGALSLSFRERATGFLLTNGTLLFARSAANGEDFFGSAPNAPGTVSPVSNFASNASAIAVSGADLYFAGTSSNHGCAGSSGSPLEIDLDPGGNFGSSTNVTCVRTGGALPVSALAVGGAALYVGLSTAGAILVQHGPQPADAGSALASFTPSSQNGIAAMALEGSTLYWATSDGTIATLATGEVGVQQLIASGSFLYWTTLGDSTAADGAVSALPLSATGSTPPTRIATAQDTPYGVYAGAPGGVTTVFWTDQGLATGRGCVMQATLSP